MNRYDLYKWGGPVLGWWYMGDLLANTTAEALTACIDWWGDFHWYSIRPAEVVAQARRLERY
jgi:hypothetical protein